MSADMVYFHSRSKDAAPGEGVHEFAKDEKEYDELKKIKDWRKVLSNFHFCPFTYKGYTYNTIEHVYQSQRIGLVCSEKAYLFTLESVINKKFDIASGSQISWSGDPLNADINVITVYKQRASISTLLNDTTNKSRIPVDCKLNINGKLFSPNIKFALDFPLIDATSKARIDNVLSDEAELNRQVFSFLLFKSFIKPQIYNLSGGGVTAGNAAASTSSEMLSNRVSEFLNSYVKNLTGIDNLQLGLNYRPANKNNNETVDIAVSKQFMNDKITIDGNFGLNNNSNSNSLIGDVNINYKLTDDGKYRLKGFNRSNDNTQITTAGGPYTQGVGILYKKEFNKLFFFKKLNKKTAK